MQIEELASFLKKKVSSHVDRSVWAKRILGWAISGPFFEDGAYLIQSISKSGPPYHIFTG
jgi:hypothetical protein